MARLEPDQGVSIEQNQRRSLRFLLKRNPSALHCHCQTPLATAGSMISMIGLRRVFFVAAWRSGCTRNRTPRRSMITDSPRSAASRRIENCCFAVAVVNRFIGHTIQFSSTLAKRILGGGSVRERCLTEFILSPYRRVRDDRSVSLLSLRAGARNLSPS